MDFKEHYNEASRLAFEEVKSQARIILKKNPELEEFIMSMGSWNFTMKNGKNTNGCVEAYNEKTDTYLYEYRPWVRPISDIISVWDDVLKITGNSVRFTAYGPEVTKW